MNILILGNFINKKKSFVKYNHVTFMVDCDKDICWLRCKILRDLSLTINFFIYFPFYLFLNKVNVHINTWICTFSHWSSTTSPFEFWLKFIVKVTIVKMIRDWTAWNATFLKLLSLSCNSKNNTVMDWLYNLKRDLTLLIRRQFLKSSYRMPRILRAGF